MLHLAAAASRRRYLRSAAGLAGGAGAAGFVTACAVPGSAPAGKAKAAVTPIRVWFHWAGPPNGDAAQQLIDQYNQTQGQEDKNQAVIEVVPGDQMLEKLTAVSVGGAPPDVWSTSTSAKVAGSAGLVEAFRAGRAPAENARADEVVIRHHVRGAQQLLRPQREQLWVAGAGSD